MRAGEGQVVPSRTTLPVSLVVRGTTERKTEGEDIETAKVSGALLSFDPNIREPLWRLLEETKRQTAYGMEVCDVLKISDNEIRWFTGEEDFDREWTCFGGNIIFP